ncbi:nucleotidyltransferase domain-containing protein [Candidatus Woesearchaeota archaeon]|nr:nucleotidyltransferase domain-containing protein [Candidatus Woesearchaeota archaeon]
MDKIKMLFFEETLKRWHFNEIVHLSGMSRERINHYLKELTRIKFLKHIKPKGKMPYYLANRESENFRFEKKMYGIKLLQKTGLFEYINSMPNVNTAILFGSFSRGDFNKSSDVDMFIFGNVNGFELAKFEKMIKRDIQLIAYDNIKSLKRYLDPMLIPNIFKGFNIKGSLEPFEVKINA